MDHRQKAPFQQSPQQQRKPKKILVLKTIPLKVKQVASTMDETPQEQTNIVHPRTTLIPIRWNSHITDMQASFLFFLRNKLYVDVTLVCEGRYLQCHKLILSIGSEHLKNMLQHLPSNNPTISLEDYNYREIIKLIEYMYGNEIIISHDELPELLYAAKRLRVRGLCETDTYRKLIEQLTIQSNIEKRVEMEVLKRE
ncbi:hypothetical protein M0802_002833 [Mischocyttarus mexicanus]|nr:hypothetical protein M0802_002833 [Mischocyttarus mexicanus]